MNYYEDLNGLLKIIKSELGKDYPTFKRKHDVKLEVFRLQCVLLCPCLSKNMFNFLLSKLLKIEKECVELEKQHFELIDDFEDYFMFFSEEKTEIKHKYNIEKCYSCGSLFHKGFLGGVRCQECFFN